MDKKLLFISHDASRTGATVAIYHFLKWLKENTNISYDILFKRKQGGAMIPSFESLAPVKIFTNTLAGKIEIFRNLLKKNGISLPPINPKNKSTMFRNSKLLNYNLIYSNTITNAEILVQLQKSKAPVLSHVHELNWGIKHYGLDRFEITKKRSDRFIAVSKAVKKNLVQNHNISEKLIDINYEFIPTQKFASIDVEQARISICQEYDLPEDAAIICASGTTGWRKAPDLFLHLAINVNRMNRATPVYYFWVGGQKGSDEFNNILYDIEKSGLKNKMFLVPEQNDPFRYYAAADVFTMVSREDPFPLVCLEAAALGKPIMCFANAGGMPEFVENDAGFVIPYLDTVEMARKCCEIIDFPDLKSKLGARAKAKVCMRHDVSVAAPKHFKIIEKTMQRTVN